MEQKHLKYFKVENFKRFESFEMNDIAQFNLIVGDNNVGKSTLLEALLFDETIENVIQRLRHAFTQRFNFHDDRNERVNFIDFYKSNKSITKQISYQIKYSSDNKLVTFLLNTHSIDSLKK